MILFKEIYVVCCLILVEEFEICFFVCIVRILRVFFILFFYMFVDVNYMFICVIDNVYLCFIID